MSSFTRRQLLVLLSPWGACFSVEGIVNVHPHTAAQLASPDYLYIRVLPPVLLVLTGGNYSLTHFIHYSSAALRMGVDIGLVITKTARGGFFYSSSSSL
jgi:hypothetical protein